MLSTLNFQHIICQSHYNKYSLLFLETIILPIVNILININFKYIKKKTSLAVWGHCKRNISLAEENCNSVEDVKDYCEERIHNR